MTHKPESCCIRCCVSGRVQGVFFRATTCQQAKHLGLSGYTRNLMDGRVEVVACGSPQALDIFKKWLWQGPSQAKVTVVQCESQAYKSLNGFRIKY
jgi:acylphosphatase